MYIRDRLGFFELIVDKERRVVHEKLSGLFTNADSVRLEKEYKNNVIPYLGEVKWVKLCDMTEYLVNSSVGHEEINYYIKRMLPYGLSGCAVIVSSESIKSLLSLSTANCDSLKFTFFTSELDADNYLKTIGF